MTRLSRAIRWLTKINSTTGKSTGDSKDIAFQIAGREAVKAVMKASQSCWAIVRRRYCPGEVYGDIMVTSVVDAGVSAVESLGDVFKAKSLSRRFPVQCLFAVRYWGEGSSLSNFTLKFFHIIRCGCGGSEKRRSVIP
jgi:hypothetical protein